MRELVRHPLIPLELDQQARAVQREILIDYDRGEIYAVSPVDKNKLINLTAKIKQAIINYLDSYQGSQLTDITNTYITIDGVGRVNIAEFLKILSHGVQAYPVDKPPMALRKLVYDNESLITYRDKVAMAGFREAGETYIPQKKNGTIQWIPITNIPNPEGYTPNKYDIGDTQPIDGVITLTENPIQKSLDLEGTNTLKLPNPTETQYCYLKWIVSAEDKINSSIVFDKRIIWRYSTDASITKGKTYIYEFETYDGGATWYGRRTTFGNYVDESAVVTKEDLKGNYFTKQEIIKLLSWNYMDEDTLKDDDGFGEEGEPDEFVKGSALLDIQYFLDDYTYVPGFDPDPDSPYNVMGMTQSINKVKKDVTKNTEDISDLDKRVTKNTNDIADINTNINTPLSDLDLDNMFDGVDGSTPVEGEYHIADIAEDIKQLKADVANINNDIDVSIESVNDMFKEDNNE